MNEKLLETQIFEMNLTAMGFSFKKDENDNYELSHYNLFDTEIINFSRCNLAGKLMILVESKIFKQIYG